jgi:hypothetical protein
MARHVHLRLSRQAEAFVEEMEEQGLTERDVFANALGLLREVWTTGQVAMITRNARALNIRNPYIQYIFQIPGTKPRTTRGGDEPEGGVHASDIPLVPTPSDVPLGRSPLGEPGD